MPARYHRAEQGRSYAGLSIHAADGVHEFAASLCTGVAGPGSRVLEVGAGSGALSRRLQDLGYSVVATDLDPAAAWIDRLDLDHSVEAAGDFGQFDVVVCVETLEHLENPRAAIRSMREFIVEGGYLVVSTPNVNHPHSRLRNLFKGAPILFGREAYYASGHITILPAWLLVEHLRDSQLEVVGVWSRGEFGFANATRRALHRMETAALGLVLGRRDKSGDGGVCSFVLARRVGPSVAGA